MNRGSYRNSMGRGRHTIGEPTRNNGSLIRSVITLVLAVALVVTLIISIPTINYRNDLRSICIGRIQTECDTAITYSRYLSRTASSNSNAQLAVIRSSVYTIQALNETYAGIEGNGQYLLDTSLFTTILNVIDNYYTKLTTGTSTSEQQTELSNLLTNLQTLAAALQ